jgi:protein-S-isoprenylcysteine O-methyltransferase Ste14
MEYLLLAALWALWCAAHSLLISVRTTAFLKDRLGDGYRYARISFNLFALLSLIPVMAYSHAIGGEPFIRWEGIWRLVQIPVLGLSLWLFAAGARAYDLRQVVGIRQIEEHESAGGITRSGGLATSGIMGQVRHPWYSGSILLLWSRNIDIAALVTNLMLTAYLIIGTFLEERKLSMEFGEEYAEYRRKVPMLIPRFGVRRSLAGRGSHDDL